MRKTTRLLAATAALAVLTMCAGCGEDDGGAVAEDETTQTPTPTETESPATGKPTAPPTDSTQTEDPMAGTEELTDAAVKDLAERAGVDASEVEVVEVEEVTWTDGSLGCAKPDMIYTQALVDGTRITLKVGEQEYAYHSGGGATPTWCKKPTE